MTASVKTLREVREVIGKHITEQQARALFAELLHVRGNKSFEETIRLLHDHYTARAVYNAA